MEIWRLTYKTYLKPISIIQKKAIRIVTFSDPRCPSEPLFKSLKLLKFPGVIKYNFSKNRVWMKKRVLISFLFHLL